MKAILFLCGFAFCIWFGSVIKDSMPEPMAWLIVIVLFGAINYGLSVIEENKEH